MAPVFSRLKPLHRKAALKLVCSAVGQLLTRVTAKVKKPRKPRSDWGKTWIARRDTSGASAQLLEELREEDKTAFKNFLRMDEDAFEALLARVTPMIQRQDTCMREAISPKVRLQVTLRYLATGDKYKSLGYLFRIPQCTFPGIIPDTCSAIITALKDDYMKIPSSPEEWEHVQKNFELRWNFPHCFGAIDSKHCHIIAPPDSGSQYYNYKGVYSIVLMAVVDANYCFQYADVGCNGRVADGGVFSNSALYHSLESGGLNLPSNHFNYMVGDAAFPLKTYLMKPYGGTTGPLSKEEKIFNYRLSRARNVVENAFGILAARFGVLQTTIRTQVETTDLIIKACCVLRNYLRHVACASHSPPESVDHEDPVTGGIIGGTWRSEVRGLGLQSVARVSGSNRAGGLATAIREALKGYFNGTGAVPWQDRMIR